jgi:hypothetical protein
MHSTGYAHSEFNHRSMLYFQQVRKGDPKRAGGLSALGSREKAVPPRSPKVAGEDEEKPYAQVMQSTGHAHS